jgi:peptide-methionine (S)-S-oxide reductase
MSRCCATGLFPMAGWLPMSMWLGLIAAGLIAATSIGGSLMEARSWAASGTLVQVDGGAQVDGGLWGAAAEQEKTDSRPARRGARASQQDAQDKTQTQDAENKAEKVLETATFGNGCYWCTEAVFQRVKGVEGVTSGFMGGHVANPTYEQVCTGLTGHAEVLQLKFDPAVVSYEKLLEIFWSSHDPTTLNRQGNDVGPMYRSAVFYHSEEQKLSAVKYKDRLTEARAFNSPIVTEITEASEFYAAPDYHQDYYNRNKSKNPYCKMITYKLQNFRKAFKDVIDTDKDKIK